MKFNSLEEILRGTQKSVSLILATAIFTFQVSPAFAIPVQLDTAPAIEQEKSAQNQDVSESETAVEPGQVTTTQDFLSRELFLERMQQPEKGRGERDVRDSGEREGFETALAQITPDYAAALILNKTPDANELEAAALQNVEHALLIIDGETVFLTTGLQGEILLHPAALQLLKAASVEGRVATIVHNHPAGQNPKPSLADIEGAEYLGSDIRYYTYGLNRAGVVEVYEYSPAGIVNESKPYTVDALAAALRDAAQPSQNTKVTRDFLHEFIKAVDYYNESKLDARELLSQGPTVFPGYPRLGAFASSSPSATISTVQSSTELFRMNYNVTNPGSFVGSFMDFGFQTPVDLSGFSKFVFEMKTDNTTAPGNQLKIEFVDTNNNRGVKFISGLTANLTQVDILPAELSGADLTKIKQIIFVVDSGMAANKPNGFVEIRSGGLDFNPTINPVPNPDAYTISPLPNKSTGERVTPSGFASGDGSSVQVDLASSTFLSLTYNGAAGGSFGGVFMNYDDPETPGIPDSETINLLTAFPAGIVLSLDNANTGLSEVTIEVSDNQGNFDFVTLTNIEGFGKKWVIQPSQFDKVDLTKVAVVSMVVKGAGNGRKLNVDWGNFYRDPIVGPVPNPDAFTITPLPKKSNGVRPTVSGFASSDGSVLNLNQASPTFVSLDYTGTGAGSFGGFFVSYDDPETPGTTDAETINLKTLYPAPNGLTLLMDDGGSSVDEIFLEFTDKNDKRALVKLTNIEGFGKKWSVSQNVMNDLEGNTGIDLTKVAVVSVLFKGQITGGKLNLDWGNFLFTPMVGSVPNPDAFTITPLPNRNNGQAPAPSSFVSNDGSALTLNQASSTFLSLNYTGTGANSFGGFFLSYDDPATPGIPNSETINIKSYSDPNGLVLVMDDGGSALEEVTLEFTDKNDRRASVRLTNIEGFGKKWSLSQAVMTELEQAFGIDLTKVAYVSVVLKGQVNNAKLNLDWGNFLYDPIAELTADPVTDFSLQEPVLGVLEPCAVNGQNPCQGTLDTVTAFNQPNNQNFSFDFNLGNGSDLGDRRFAGSILSFGNQYVNAATPIVLGIKGTGQTNGELKLLFEDFDGRQVVVRVKGLTANFQNFKVTKALLESAGVAGFDTTRISTIVILTDASTAGSSTAVGSVQVNSKGLAFTKEITNDPAKGESDITLLPLLASGDRVNVGGFAKADGSTAVVSNVGDTFAKLTYTGAAADSFGGIALDYTGSEFNFNTQFPNGIVLRLDSPNVTSVLLELTDLAGKRDTVRLINLEGFGKYYVIQGSDFYNIDLTKIKTVAFVFDGLGVKTLNVGWGLFDATKELTNDPTKTESDITLLPLLASGDRVNVGGFAKNDGSTALISNVGDTFAKLTYTGSAADSFGGIALDYTGSEFNFNTQFPNGIVLRLDSPNVTSVLLELTDMNGKRDSVRLINLEGFGKYYVIQGSDFFNIDLTKIKTVSFVFEGLGVKTLNVGWGLFDATKELTNDPTKGESDITLLPLLSNGERVNVGGFAKNDGSDAVISNVGDTFAKLTYTGAAADSFGGIALDYTGSEFNFNTQFPNGIVLRLDSPNVTSVLLELTDMNGKRDSVRLINLEGFGKYYVIQGSDFFNIDLTKIKTVSFVFEGLGVKTLNVGWGLFDATKELTNDPTKGESDITLLPLLSNGERVNVGGFAKADGSDAVISNVGDTFAKLTYTGALADSFGGIALDYTGSEFNFNTQFPNGIVLRLDSPNVTSVLLELTDMNGKRDSVRLINLEGFGKYYVIQGSDFFNIDLTKIKTVSFVFEGLGVKTLNVGWGLFDATKELTNDPTKGESDITLLPLLSNGERVNVGGFAKNDGSDAVISNVGDTFAKLTYTGAAADSFGGIALDYTGSEFNFNTQFPNGIVLRLDSPNVTSVLLELTDMNGKRDSVRLINLEGFGKYYVIQGSDFFNIDLTKIKTVSFVFEGLGVKTLNVGWGLFDATKELTNDPTKTESDITLLPLLASGDRVNVGGFAKADGSDAVISNVGDTFAKLTYTGAAADSFGGIALDYTGSEFNFNTQFPNGIVLRLDSPDVTSVLLELTDMNGKRDSVRLINLEGFGKYYVIQGSDFFNIDLTKIKTVSFVFEGLGVKTLNVGWGLFDATKELTNDPTKTESDITLLPLLASGDRVNVGGFAKADGSDAVISNVGDTFAKLTYTGAAADSFGGIALDYTGSEFNFNTQFPNGIVLRLDSPNVTSVLLELTDMNGKRDSVRLINLEGFGKYYVIQGSDFFNIDLTKIKTVSFVFEGLGVKTLNVGWGLFDATKELTNDPTKTESDITLLPLLSNGERVNVGGFAKNDGSDAVISNVGDTFAKLTYTGAAADSFGGIALDYTGSEFNFNTQFPNGIVLRLDSPNVTSVLLELTDMSGKRDSVRLINLEGFGKYYVIQGSDFFNIDLTKIKTVSFVFEGLGVKTLNVGWGLFDATKELTNDPTKGESDITLLPLLSNGERVNVGGFAKADGSDAVISNVGDTFAKLTYTGAAADSFGGIALDYTGSEFNFNTQFPNGIVLRLDSPDVTSVLLELTDMNGKRDSVRLINLEGFGKYYVIQGSDFFNIDLTKIKTVSFVFEGLGVKTLNVGWGLFDATKELTNDPTKGESDITLLPLLSNGERVNVGGFAKADGSDAVISNVGDTFAKLTYTGAAADSFGGIALDYTGSEFNFNTQFPNGIVLRLDSPDVTSVLLELTDMNGKRDSVRLINLEGFGKYYVIQGSDFFNIDLTKIKTVSFVFEGLGVKTLNVGWGLFDATKELTNDPTKTESDITLLPLLASGDRVNVGGFAKADGSDAVISNVGDTFAKLTYTGAAADSFGGIALDYTGSEFNFNTQFPNGIVLRLDSPNVTSVLLELTDMNGKRDSVRLINLEGFGKYYVIQGSDFFNIDLTKIKTVSFVFEGLGVKTLNVGWGLFDATKELTNDPTKGESDITLLPLLSNGERVNVGGFAKADGSDAVISNVGDTFAKLTYTGAAADSFGGIALDYTGSEFNFNTQFPNGIVLRLDSPDVTSVLLELTDMNGKRDSVRLINLEGFGKYYVIQGSDFFNIDLTKIKTVSFVFEGLGVKTLNVGWGLFDATKELTNDPTKTESDITLLPLLSNGERVNVGGFAKNDGSDAVISNVGDTFAKLTYTGALADSFGGIALDYTGSEFNFNTQFPNGIVLRLDSPDVTSVLLELTDMNGKRDSVRLINLEGFGKYYVIQGSDFFNIDLTKIKTVSFVFEGLGVKTLNVGWGLFDATKELTNDPTKTESDITLLPLLSNGERVNVGGFAKNDGSDAVISNVGDTFAKLTYTGAAADSFGGIALDYTGSEFNFNTQFPNGIVLRLDSPNVTSVLLELTDLAGKRDTVRLINLEGFGKYYVIQGSDFFNIDLTKIKTVSFVFEGLGVKTLNVGWGLFDATKELTNDPTKTESDITLLPLLSNGERVNVGGFAKNDGSDAVISNVGDTFAKLTYTGALADSFGGIALDYTGSEFNFNTQFPNGIVLRLDSPNVTSVLLELTDMNGKRDSVRLINLEGFGKYYVIQGSDFFNIDLTKIKTVSFVFEGLGVKTLNVGWGLFDATKELTNDPTKTESDITLLPLLSNGERVNVGGFAKNDGSDAVISNVGDTFAKLTYTGALADSFGGIALDYTGSEFNFNTQFPSGIVLRLDSPDVTSVLLELTDMNGKRDSVRLINLEGFGKYYVIQGSDFFNIDLTKIKTVSFVFEGLGVKTLNVGWGLFDATKELTNDPTKTESDITLLPLLASGDRVNVGGFAKNDGSDAVISNVGDTFAKLTYTGALADSFGGIALDYTGSEFNFNTQFPNGIVLRLDSPDVTSVLLELTDMNGKRDSVRLINLEGFGKYYVIQGSDFFNIDLTKIKTVSFVFEGLGVKTLNVGWGLFDATKELTNDPTKTESDITLLPLLSNGERVNVGGFAKNDGSDAVISNVGDTFAKLTYTGALADSFGGIALDYTGSEFNFNTQFPNGIVLRLDSPNVTSVLLELTDMNGKRDSVRLINLEGFGKYYVIQGSDFFNIDLTKIKTVSFVFEGLGVKTLNVGWGLFDATKELTNDPTKTESDITLLPLLSNGERVNVGGFAKNDGSDAVISNVGDTFAKLTYTGALADSFGGIALDYTGSEFNFNTQFPSGIVLRLDSPDVTSVLLELTDMNGKRDSVRLINLEGFGKYYVIQGSDFFNIDLTKIKTVSFVFEGLGVKTLNVGWGLFDATKELTNDPTKTESDITLLPLLSNGNRVAVGGFSKLDGSSAAISDQTDTFAKLTYTGAAADSFGGIALDYTGSEFNFNTAFPNGIVLRLDSPNVTSVLLELTDMNGKRDSVKLINLEGFGKYYVIQGSDFFNIDLTAIKTIAFVFEGAGTKTLNVRWGLFGGFTPKAVETNDPLTDFSVQSPSLGELEPCSIIGQNPCTAGTFNTVTNLTQDSANHFSFNFDLANGDDVEFRRFGGTIINFGGSPFDSTQDIVLEFKGSGPTTSKLKLDFVDVNGKKVTVNVEGVDTSFKRYKISRAILESAGILGFDATKIAVIVVVVDPSTAGTSTSSGKVDVNTLGLKYTVIDDGDPLDPLVHTVLPNLPGLSATGANTIPNRIPGFITQTQISDKDYKFNYDLIGSQTAFVFSQIAFDQDGEALPENLILALKGPAGANLKFEFEDSDGTKFSRTVALQGDFRNYTLALSGADVPAGFDRSKVRFITLVLDRGLVNGILKSTIEIKTAGLLYMPVLNGSAYDASLHTLMPNRPGLTATGANTIPNRTPGFITQTQTSDKDYQFVYDLIGSQTAFVFSQIAFDQDGEALPQNVVLGLKGQAGVKVKVEIEDANGKKFFNIINLQGDLRNYTLSLSGSHVPAGFDRNKVRYITFVLDRGLAGGVLKSTVEVKTAGLMYTPLLSGTPFNEANHTLLPNRPGLLAAGGNTVAGRVPGFITQTQTSAKSFKFNYDLTASQTAFVFSQIGFKNGVVSLPQTVTVGVKGPAGVKVKVEIQDANGNKIFNTLILQGDFRNYALSLSGSHVPPSFDLTKILNITFVLDRDLAKVDLADTIEIRTAGLDFEAVLNGNTYNEDAVTDLTGSPSASATGSNTVPNRTPGSISLKQNSPDEFEYAYNLEQSQTSFAFVNVSHGTFNGNGQFQGTPGVLPENFVVAARGSEGSQTRVEITDTNGVKARFVLNLRPAYQNYTLPLNDLYVPAGFNRNSIAQIVFVQDRSSLNKNLTDVVKINLKGVAYTAPQFSADLLAVKNQLVEKGVSFFKSGAGLDPATHFPYDAVNVDGQVEQNSKFTQPTLIGFYLQMLGDALNGSIDLDMTQAEILTEMNFLMDNLLDFQSDYGWKGLLPFMHLAPTVFPSPSGDVGIGDNLNLIQSMAVMSGAIERSGLTGAALAQAAQIIAKSEQFMDNQEEGYKAAVHPTFGLFHNAYNTQSGQFVSFLDRTAVEFRGAIAFAVVRYPDLQDSVWTNLFSAKRDYKDRNGNTISNLASFDGSAFQIFWPLLRNNEMDFVGFRNALYNQFASQADFAAKYRIPGFLSAAEIPENHLYVGDLGIRDLSETSLPELTTDVGSTYALASAFAIAPQETLVWLKAIGQINNVNGLYGYVDSARSATETAKRFLGIDLASTVLGLMGTGPKDFEIYLRNRGKELEYNLLYDAKDDNFQIAKTGAGIAAPPEFADRSLSVFRNTVSTGTINNFPVDNSFEAGVHYQYGSLDSGFGGQVFNLQQPFNATAAQLVMQYSVLNSPKQIKFEFKDGSDNKVFEVTKNLVDMTSGLSVEKLVIDFPNLASLSQVQKVVLVIDQNATGDSGGDFRIHSMVFQHLASSQTLNPKAGLTSGQVTVLPGNPPAQLFSSSANSSLNRISSSLSTLNFDVSQNGFAGISINFDPQGNTQGANLSGLTRLVFGLDSAKAKKVKMEIDDADGRRAVYYLDGITGARGYYELLTSTLGASIDLTKVKRINFVVDAQSIQVGNETGSLTLELGGLLFP